MSWRLQLYAISERSLALGSRIKVNEQILLVFIVDLITCSKESE